MLSISFPSASPNTLEKGGLGGEVITTCSVMNELAGFHTEGGKLGSLYMMQYYRLIRLNMSRTSSKSSNFISGPSIAIHISRLGSFLVQTC